MNLDNLHAQLALALPKALLARIAAGEATAADLNVARQYLKDNGVQSTPSANPHMPELALKLGDVVLDDEDAA
jgi:hypothetical protein